MAKMTKQDLQHDEMSDLGDKLQVWYEKNSTLITTLLVIVVAVFGGYRLWDVYRTNKLTKISEDYGRVVQDYNAAVAEKDDAKRVGMLSSVTSESERLAAEYPSEFAGRSALLMLGNIQTFNALSKLDKPEECISYLKSARDAYDRYVNTATNPAEKAAGQVAVANTLENLAFRTRDANVTKEAVDMYNAAAKTAPENSYVAAEAKLGLARLYQNQTGKQEEARKEYTEVAAMRKPALSIDAKEKPYKTDDGREVSPEDLAKLRKLYNFSYAAEAERQLSLMKGLPTSR